MTGPSHTPPSSSTELARIIRAEVPALHEQAEDLARSIHQVMQQWPALTVQPKEFLAHLAQHLAAKPSLDVQHLRWDELILAYACGQGDSRAIAELEKRYLQSMPRVMGKLNLQEDTEQEVTQRLRETLLVGEQGAGRPQILSYSGFGRLRNFIRIIAFRTAYQLLGQGAREVLQEEVVIEEQENMELQFLKQTYRAEFKVAFHEAIHLLTDRELALLQFHYMEQLTVDQIGALYQVHRATAARWVAKARVALLEHTRGQLETRLQISGAECDSIVRLLESRLYITLPSVLRMR